jgi:hypothetical protein
MRTSLQTGLLQDAVLSSKRKIITGLQYGDSSRLGIVLELAMAASLRGQEPAVLL